MMLIDSSGWIEYFGDGKNAHQFAKYIESASPQTHITPVSILYEVYKWIACQQGEEKALEIAAYIITHSRIIVLDPHLAITAAEVSRMHKLGMADAIVKATADHEHAKIITGDADFKGFQNVIFIPKHS